MLVSDLKVDDEYIIVGPDETVQQVAKRLLQGYYGTALVRAGKEIVGAITMDIIVAKTVVEAKDPTVATAQDIMDENVVKVNPETDIKNVDQDIRRVRPSAVVVCDSSSGDVLGYVSPLDMMEALQSIVQG